MLPRIKRIIIAACLLFIHSFYAQNLLVAQAIPGMVDSSLIAKPYPHFQAEYTFDIPVDPVAWQNQQEGLHAAFGSTDEVYFRAEVPRLKNETKTLEGTVWKGERLNAIILIWSPDTISQVRFILNDLENSRGNRIDKNNISLNLVRYVISNYPYDAKEVTCGVGPLDKAYLLPDRLEEFNRFNLSPRTVRPVWLSVDVPPGTAPGTYNGTIEVRSEKQSEILNLSVIVQNQMLPEPHDWSFLLDLWQNPWVIAEYYKVKPWGTEHKLLLKKHLKLYAGAGGKYITTYAVHSPWADNSYMIEASMIEWIKRKNGSWKFDYNIFDQYVQLAIDAGIDKAITLYTPIPWGDRFRYIDEVTGNYKTEQWRCTSDTFKTNWNIFLTDLKMHLEKKGWFNRTYIGINENAMEQTLAAIKVVKAHSKKWRITYAGDWHPVLDSLLDDYSCVYGKEPSMEDIRKRTVKGQTSTFYICCTPPKPNTFVFSPPVEGRWLGWYAFAAGYNGLLRWAYDAWVADPSRDTRHIYWPAGDAFMVYPGGASSIRFEKMREGIVDYEKMRILKAKAERSADPEIKKKLAALQQHLQMFTKERDFKSEELVRDIESGKRIINELGDKL